MPRIVKGAQGDFSLDLLTLLLEEPQIGWGIFEPCAFLTPDPLVVKDDPKITMLVNVNACHLTPSATLPVGPRMTMYLNESKGAE